MNVKLPTSSPIGAATSQPVGESTSLVDMKMAPLSLTPLATPGPGPSSVQSPGSSEDKLAPERRQTRFADKQRQLLERLADPGTQVHQGAALLPAQRLACNEILKVLVAAHAAGLGTQ